MFAQRAKILLLCTTFLFAAAVARLFYLQIIMGNDYRKAEQEKLRGERLIPEGRGTIRDRNGEVLAQEYPSYNVGIVPTLVQFEFFSYSKFKKYYAMTDEDAARKKRCKRELLAALYREPVVKRIAWLSGRGEVEIAQGIMKAYKNIAREWASRRTEQVVLRDISFDAFAEIERRSRSPVDEERLNGVRTSTSGKRIYPHGSLLCHILGHLGKVTPEDMKQLREDFEIKSAVNGNEYHVVQLKPAERDWLKKHRYLFNMQIGKAGIEQRFNERLRGKHGHKVFSRPNLVEKFDDSIILPQEAAEKGEDLTLTIDLRLQRIVERNLKGKDGAIVVLDPASGEILAVASYPNYDLNIYTEPRDNAAIIKLNNDKKRHPLVNRALKTAKPLGSVFKITVALAALKHGTITPEKMFLCTGSYTLGNRTLNCMGLHNNIALHNAIKYSCNVYFCKTAVKLGIDKLRAFSQTMGFMQHTGVELSDTSGQLPTRDIMNFSIGQGQVNITPLQAVRMIAVVANGGFLVTPHFEKLDVLPESIKPKRLPISPQHIEEVRRGMYLAVNDPGGTSVRARPDDLDFVLCGKTGTAEWGVGPGESGNAKRVSHAWFGCYGPKEKPRIAMIIFLSGAWVSLYSTRTGLGGIDAAPIAKKILDEYLKKP